MRRFVKNRKGFSLIEMMLAVLIFSLVMTATMSVFVSVIKVKSRAKDAQRNMEDAKYALELMSKTLRTSTIISCNNIDKDQCGNSIVNSIEVYDYSQNLCVRYLYNTGTDKLSWGTRDAGASGVDGCNPAPAAVNALTGSFITYWRVVAKPSDATTVGQVTITLQMCSKSGATCAGTNVDTFTAQTTVSLRDYKEVGI